MEACLKHFTLQGEPLSCDRYGEGHINRTYLVVTDAPRRYILQRLSRAAFHDIPALMANVTAVTGFLSARTKDPRACLHLIPTRDDRSYYCDEEGEYWRVYDFVEDSLCLQSPESPEDFYQSAVAFGSFQRLLLDFPAEQLHETIPNFHNTPDRYRIFHRVLAADPLGRAPDVQAEIDFVLAREKEADTLLDMHVEGKLPPARNAQRYQAQQRHARRRDTRGAVRHRPGHGHARSGGLRLRRFHPLRRLHRGRG